MYKEEDVKRLTEVLGIADDERFKILVLEMIGELVLSLHWMRGALKFMTIYTGTVKFAKPEQQKNFARLMDNIEQYEGFIWEEAPARASLPMLRQFRITGELLADFEKILVKDPHGRIPFGTSPKDIDDIRDIMRRANEARVAYYKQNPAEDEYAHAHRMAKAASGSGTEV